MVKVSCSWHSQLFKEISVYYKKHERHCELITDQDCDAHMLFSTTSYGQPAPLQESYSFVSTWISDCLLFGFLGLRVPLKWKEVQSQTSYLKWKIPKRGNAKQKEMIQIGRGRGRERNRERSKSKENSMLKANFLTTQAQLCDLISQFVLHISPIGDGWEVAGRFPSKRVVP